MGTSVDFPAWAAIIVVVLGIVGTVGSAIAVFRQAAIKSTLEAQRLSMELIVTANAELRKAYDDQKKELDAERVARATLEGKLEVFTTHFAQQIIDIVTRTVAATTTTHMVVTSSNDVPRSPDARERKDDHA